MGSLDQPTALARQRLDATLRAPELLRAAARQGRARALRNLGVAYFVGRGVPRDLSAAYGWFWLAARNGSEMAAPDAAHVASLLGEERTAEARRVAQRWEEQHRLSTGEATRG